MKIKQFEICKTGTLSPKLFRYIRFPDSEGLRKIQFQLEFINLILQALLQRFYSGIFSCDREDI
jgi:hypothetical protein